MAKGKLFVLANAVSPAREAEFNTWYNEIHAKEVCALPGFVSMKRYRINEQNIPAADTPEYRYVAIYELSDTELALKSMAENQPKLNMSDALDGSRVMAMTISETYNYVK